MRNEGLTPAQLAITRSWEATILGVAVEEMGHLGTVCNLLAAIGDGPRFERPNFPQQIGYYPSRSILFRSATTLYTGCWCSNCPEAYLCPRDRMSIQPLLMLNCGQGS